MDQLAQRGRPCWPLIWLWLLSIAQYAYRYILQVNDPRTSPAYDSTPAYLSAIKYAILIAFAAYSLFQIPRGNVFLSSDCRKLLSITGWALVALAAILLARLIIVPGDLSETANCALQLVPWAATVFFVPLLFTADHDIVGTLLAFERLAFWVVFPFWLLTVALVVAGARYPALSYPGVIVRFGGILDDPNGYACLCLLLLILSAGGGARGGKIRTGIYAIMLLCTLSLSGYFTATIACVAWIYFRLKRPGIMSQSKVAKALLACAAGVALLAVILAIVSVQDTVTAAMDTLYSAKGNSAETHISNIAPDSAMLDASSPAEFLLGIGGFSENFYWRVLVNFGWIGLIAMATLISAWMYYALRRQQPWRDSLRAWCMAILTGAVGIAYLLVFPLNLIYWSLLAMLVQAGGLSKAPRET